MYLNKSTVGQKLEKVKAIRCHYYRYNKKAVITEELSSERIQDDEEFESEEAESDNDFVFTDLDEQSSPSATGQFMSYGQITAVVVQGLKDVITIIDITCILTLSFCGGWERRGAGS